MRIFPPSISILIRERSVRERSTLRRGRVTWLDGSLYLLLVAVVGGLLLGLDGSRPTAQFRIPQSAKIQLSQEANRYRTVYRGFRTGNTWEVVVARPGHPMRLLERPSRAEEWPLAILTDYLGDRDRATALYRDFASLTIDHFAGDWELSGKEIDRALLEVETHRTRWRSALIRT